ncbi:MAG TPA: trypsin-like peptidase domain-containing protein [Parasegetibacter sp.]
MLNRILLIIFCVTIVFKADLYSQSVQAFNHLQMQAEVQKVIDKVYPATVKIVNYDSTRKVVRGGQFSGVVVSQDGYILTAAHASTPGDVYLAIFPDGKEFVAVGLGRITTVDAAVIKITQPGIWPWAEMGWSSSLKSFQPCVSISGPASLNRKREPVVRFGYVAQNEERYGYIRTTCLMEPGDSGGPVFDLKGRVIGIHSRIDAGVEGNYEVAVDNFRKYWDALIVPESYNKNNLPDEGPIGVDPVKDEFASIVELGDLSSYFSKTEARLDNSVFEVKSIVDGDSSVILGTLVSSAGFKTEKNKNGGSFLISKSSMVGDEPIIILDNSRGVSAAVISRDEKLDLVLLKVNSKLKGGLDLFKRVNDSVDFSQVGRFLLSPHPKGEGEVSVVGSTLFGLAASPISGYLGATSWIYDSTVVLREVIPGTAASSANLQEGDTVLSINDQPIKTVSQFNSVLNRHKPKETIQIRVLRDNREHIIDVVLGKRPPVKTHAADYFEEGKSERRDGFQNIFMHDGNLRPSECGGPVFDVFGNLTGINIARFSRTSSIAIPVKAVRQFVEESLKGK